MNDAFCLRSAWTLLFVLSCACDERATEPSFESPELARSANSLAAAASAGDASTEQSAQPGRPSTVLDDKTRQEVRDIWSFNGLGCSMGDPVRTPAEVVMKSVPAGLRASAINEVIQSESLGSARIRALLGLLAATRDDRAFEFIEAAYARADALVTRNLKEALETNPDEERMSAFRDGEVLSVKVAAVEAASSLDGSAVAPFLERALQEGAQVNDAQGNGRLLRASIIALAKKPDAASRQQLGMHAAALHEGMRGSVVELLKE